MARVKAKVAVTMPRFHRLRMALAIKLVGWAAGLIAGVVNGIRIDVA